MERLHPMMKYGNFIEVYNNLVSGPIDRLPYMHACMHASIVISSFQSKIVSHQFHIKVAMKEQVCAMFCNTNLVAFVLPLLVQLHLLQSTTVAIGRYSIYTLYIVIGLGFMYFARDGS